MARVEKYDDLIIGSGIAGKFTAWTRDSRRRLAIVERGLLGGACPNVACLPSKNIIWSAKVISLARRGIEFGLKTDSLSVDMAAVQTRKRTMVRELRTSHEDHTEASGAELIYGVARFVAPAPWRSSCAMAVPEPSWETASFSTSVRAPQFCMCPAWPRLPR
jgi:pyruvate/2-oxoglutarate dehydrogenase complex dihydrolipoamide dehydrogenase (E3) component